MDEYIIYIVIAIIAINAYSYFVTKPLAEKKAISKVEAENKELIQTIEKSIPRICPNCGTDVKFKSIICMSCGSEMQLTEKVASAQKELQQQVKKYAIRYYILYDVLSLSVGGFFAGYLVGPWFGFATGKLGWPGIIAFMGFSFLGFVIVEGII